MITQFLMHQIGRGNDMRALIIKWLWNILHAFDILLNAITGGDPEETISSRMGKAIAAGRCKLCRPICRALNKLFHQENHCGDAAEKHAEEGADEIIKL